MNRSKRSKQQTRMTQMKTRTALVIALLLIATLWSLSGFLGSKHTLRQWDESVLIRQISKCTGFTVTRGGRNTKNVFTLDDGTQLVASSDYLSKAELDGESLEGIELEFVYTKQTFRLTGKSLLVEIRRNGEVLLPASLGKEAVEEEAKVYSLLLGILLLPWLLFGVVWLCSPKRRCDHLRQKRKARETQKLQ